MRSIARIAMPLLSVLVIGCAQQPAVTPAQTASQWLAGAGGDSTVHLKVSLERRENGDAVVKSTIQNLSRSEIRLLYDCKNLIRLNGRRIIYDCDPLPDRRLAPGKSGLEEITVPAAEVDKPTQGALVYALPGQEPVTLSTRP